MTCAHIVDVALKKVPGVETVDVSLNKGLATVKLSPGNKVSVPQFWRSLHEKGYTPKATAVSVRGEPAGGQGRLQLKVTGTTEVLNLVPDPKNPDAYNDSAKKVGHFIVIQGVMVPGKDLNALVPFQVDGVK
jgi:copper chaperone CopZ